MIRGNTATQQLTIRSEMENNGIVNLVTTVKRIFTKNTDSLTSVAGLSFQ